MENMTDVLQAQIYNLFFIILEKFMPKVIRDAVNLAAFKKGDKSNCVKYRLVPERNISSLFNLFLQMTEKLLHKSFH